MGVIIETFSPPAMIAGDTSSAFSIALKAA
jgi:hypothetical protein